MGLQRIPVGLAHQPLAFGKGCHHGGVFVDALVVAQHRQRLLHASHRALQRRVGVQHQAIAQGGQFFGTGDGGLAANHHVHQLRRCQPLGQGADLVEGGDSFDKQDVGASLLKPPGALHGGLEALGGAGVGAGQDEGACVAACVHGRLDLAQHLVGGNHLLAVEMPAALGADLVFELDAVGPRALQHPHRVVGVERVAKAGVGIDDERQVHRVADARRVVGNVGEAHEGLVGQAEPHVGHACAGHVKGFKPQVGHHAGREGVEGAGHDDAPAGLGQRLELLFGIHVVVGELSSYIFDSCWRMNH